MEEGKQEFNWPPLESNPEVFTEYMHKMGMPQEWMIGECFGLDPDCLGFVPKPTVAMIANCERLKKTDDKEKGSMDNKAEFYMKQTSVLDNACGVIACLHSIFNNQDSVKVQADSIMAKYFAKSKDQTPEDRATSLENYSDF